MVMEKLHAEDGTLALQIKKLSNATELGDRAHVIGEPIRTQETRDCRNSLAQKNTSFFLLFANS
jgi:hypothetical protein